MASDADLLEGLDTDRADSAARFIPSRPTLKTLRVAAAGCTACPLFKLGTQTVFGEGPAPAPLMLVGEQPGDYEDRAGRALVGPARHILGPAPAPAGVDRDKAYVTNAVKHFKWTPRGKRRLHSKPSGPEIAACHPWLQAELELVAPEVLVCLGATAAQALLGRDFRVTKQRGTFIRSDLAPHVMATVHPSSLLRLPPQLDPEVEFHRFVSDLRKVAAVLSR
jgi:uracil-DNA glycosylase family protein